MFIAEMDHPDFAKFDLSSLRTGMMAGSPCPIEVMKRAFSLMHLSEVVIGYGMTETSPASFASATDDPIERRVSTVGRILPHVEAKVIDAEGRIVPRGAAGELLTRGYLVMLGYWDDEEKTREAIDPAGWMHTGDLATIDGEGYCNIVGRIKDMVIRGGENVCAPGFACATARTRLWRISAPFAKTRSRTTRCRATSNSSTASR